LLLPEASPAADRVIRYLTGRGIDRDLIGFCLQSGRLYESLPYHNAVFMHGPVRKTQVCQPAWNRDGL
jgi:hypothetical protein